MRMPGRAGGPRHTCSSPRPRSARGCASGASSSSPSSAGPSAAATPRPATATRFRAFTSPGAPVRESLRRSRRNCGTASRRGSSTSGSGTEWMSWSSKRALSSGSAARSWPRMIAERGEPSNRDVTGSFDLRAPAVIVDDRRHRRQPRPRARAVAEAHGQSARRHAQRRAGIRRRTDARRSPRRPARALINGDRMWHYVEGITNYAPVWPKHGIRILPGPSSVWLDATGKRLPVPLFPGLRHARHARAHRGDRPRLQLVRAHAEDHREGIRAVGQRAESRLHRQEHPAAARSGSARERPGRSRHSRRRARTSSSPTRSTS